MQLRPLRARGSANVLRQLRPAPGLACPPPHPLLKPSQPRRQPRRPRRCGAPRGRSRRPLGARGRRSAARRAAGGAAARGGAVARRRRRGGCGGDGGCVCRGRAPAAGGWAACGAAPVPTACEIVSGRLGFRVWGFQGCGLGAEGLAWGSLDSGAGGGVGACAHCLRQMRHARHVSLAPASPRPSPWPPQVLATFAYDIPAARAHIHAALLPRATSVPADVSAAAAPAGGDGRGTKEGAALSLELAEEYYEAVRRTFKGLRNRHVGVLLGAAIGSAPVGDSSAGFAPPRSSLTAACAHAPAAGSLPPGLRCAQRARHKALLPQARRRARGAPALGAPHRGQRRRGRRRGRGGRGGGPQRVHAGGEAARALGALA
jgi:hypothetical protein